MNSKDKINSEYLTIFLNISYFFIILCQIFYIFVTYKYLFHSDASVSNLLAREVIATGKIFPSSWYYVNNDLYTTIFGYIFIAPLLLFFENSFLLHAIVSFLFLIIYLVSIHYFTNTLNLSTNMKILTKIFLITPLSMIGAENLFGQQAYLWAVIDLMLLLLIFYNVFHTKLKYKYLVISILVFILLHIIVSNPLRGIFFYYIPFFTAFYLLYYRNSTKQYKKKYLFYFFFLLIILIVSYLLNLYIKKDLSIIEISSAITYADPIRVVKNIFIFITGILANFSIVKIDYKLNFNFLGILSVINLFILLFFLYASKKLYIRRKELTQYQKFILLFCIVSFSSIMFIYIFAYPLAVNEWTIRYFSIPISLMSLFIVFYLEFTKKLYYNKIILIFLTLVLSFNAFSHFVLPAFNKNYEYKKNIKQELSNFLVTKNLSHGYASFWNSGVFTVLSKEKVLIAPINLKDSTPMKWLSSKRWYKVNKKEFFILLTKKEIDIYNKSSLHECLGKPSNTYNFENYIILNL